MRRAIVTTFAALFLVTAGCLSSPLDRASANGDTTGSAEVSALTHWDAAMDLAESWNASAKLVEVVATEGPALRGHVDPPVAWETATDPDAGNGLAILWTYVFVKPDNVSLRYYASFAGDGTTLYANELPAPYYHAYPVAHTESPSTDAAYPTPSSAPPELVRPAVDSDAAIDAAQTFDVFATFAVDHPRHQVALALVQTTEGPMWALHKMTATYFGAGVMVDASDGTVRHTWSHPTPVAVDPPEPPCDDCGGSEPRPDNETTTHSGTIDGPSPLDPYSERVATFTFDVASSYWFRDATVEITADTLPGERLVMRIISPEGWESAWAWGESSTRAVMWDWAQRGTYTVEVWVEGNQMRDVPFDATTTVRYEEPAPRHHRDEWHSVSAWSGPMSIEMPVDPGAEHLLFDLASTVRGPTDGIYLRVEGPDGVVFEDEIGDAPYELKVDGPVDGMWTITAWATQSSVFPVDVHVLAEVAYPSWEEPKPLYRH